MPPSSIKFWLSSLPTDTPISSHLWLQLHCFLPLLRQNEIKFVKNWQILMGIFFSIGLLLKYLGNEWKSTAANGIEKYDKSSLPLFNMRSDANNGSTMENHTWLPYNSRIFYEIIFLELQFTKVERSLQVSPWNL